MLLKRILLRGSLGRKESEVEKPSVVRRTVSCYFWKIILTSKGMLKTEMLA